MTAPNTMDQQTQFAPRQFAGRRASGGSGGDGGWDANGVMSMPHQSQGQPPQGQPRQWQTSHPPTQPMQSGAQPTFAQMQNQGIARPNPPQGGGMQPPSMNGGQVGGALAGAVTSALQNPSRYDLPQVQQVYSGLQGQLQQQFGAQQKQLDEEMARRGIAASSFGGGYQGDLAGQQSNALASMTGSLIQDAAKNNAQDQSAALGAGQAYQTGQQNYALGQGALGIQQQQADTTRGLGYGNLDLGQQQLNQSGQQFQQNLGLQSQLGLGGLGVQQGQLDLSKLQNQQQYGLAGANLSLAQQKQQQDYALGQGQLGVSQGDLALRGQLGLGGLNIQQQQANTQAQQVGQEGAYQQGQLGLGQAQLQQSGSQFGQSLAEQQAARQQQFGLQSQAQATQANQFDRSIGAQLEQQRQQFGLSQQDLALRSQLGQGGLDLQRQQVGNEGAYQQGQLGLGQGQLSLAQLANQQQYGLSGANLSLEQQKAQQQYQLGMGGLGVQQEQVGNQASQFGQSFGLQSLQNQQQYGLQSQAQQLAAALGYGNLGVQQQQVQNQSSQFGQTLAQQQLQNQQQYGLQSNAQNAQQQQFAQSLQQALAMGQMGDKTQNRQIDATSNLANNTLMMQLAMLGIGGGATGGTGATGGAGGASNTASFLNSAAGQQMQQSDPATYAKMALAGDQTNWGTGTVNFGGKQYSVKDYYTLMSQHPELFKTQTPDMSLNQDGDYIQKANALRANPVMPTQSGDALDQWGAQHAAGPRYSNINGVTVDNYANSYNAIKGTPVGTNGMDAAGLAGYGFNPELDGLAAAATKKGNDAFTYGQTHGGYGDPANDPNALYGRITQGPQGGSASVPVTQNGGPNPNQGYGLPGYAQTPQQLQAMLAQLLGGQ